MSRIFIAVLLLMIGCSLTLLHAEEPDAYLRKQYASIEELPFGEGRRIGREIIEKALKDKALAGRIEEIITAPSPGDEELAGFLTSHYCKVDFPNRKQVFARILMREGIDPLLVLRRIDIVWDISYEDELRKCIAENKDPKVRDGAVRKLDEISQKKYILSFWDHYSKAQSEEAKKTLLDEFIAEVKSNGRLYFVIESMFFRLGEDATRLKQEFAKVIFERFMKIKKPADNDLILSSILEYDVDEELKSMARAYVAMHGLEREKELAPFFGGAAKPEVAPEVALDRMAWFMVMMAGDRESTEQLEKLIVSPSSPFDKKIVPDLLKYYCRRNFPNRKEVYRQLLKQGKKDNVLMILGAILCDFDLSLEDVLKEYIASAGDVQLRKRAEAVLEWTPGKRKLLTFFERYTGAQSGEARQKLFAEFSAEVKEDVRLHVFLEATFLSLDWEPVAFRRELAKVIFPMLAELRRPADNISVLSKILEDSNDEALKSMAAEYIKKHRLEQNDTLGPLLEHLPGEAAEK